nr:xanthine dehydrogenase family protein molybdopterin-binding subunit [Pedomonas mirosovicensis]
MGHRRRAGLTAGTGLEATPFIRISPDNTVTVLAKHLEMGQGTWSGLATIVAEELDADWSQMRAEGAPARVPDYANLAFGTIQGTGGSTAMFNSWEQLRKAGATARAMLVSAAARKWGAQPSEITVERGVVRHAASGKQATFGELATLASSETVPATVPLKDPKDFTLVGKRIHRLDNNAKTDGTAVYGIDMAPEGTMTAVIQRAPRFGGKVKSFDAAAARAVPGVVDVVQVPSGVAVVAKNTFAAIKGREALTVEWDETAAEKRGTAELTAEYRKLAEAGGGMLVGETGKPAEAMASAAKVVEATFEFPFLAHASMEPMTGWGRLTKDGAELAGGFQFHTIDQGNVAKVLGLAPEKVNLTTIVSGGSFGRRANFQSDWVVEIANILKATGGKYPVRLVWTREDDVTGGYYRPMAVHKVKAGLSASGDVVAWDQTIVHQSILAGTPFSPADKPDGAAVEGNVLEQYALPAARVTWVAPKVGVPVLWWRSVGHTHNAYVKEVMIDQLAEAAGQDPVAFRLKLLEKHPRIAGVLKLAAEKAGWGKPLPKGRYRGVAVQESFRSYVAQVAEISYDGKDFRVERVVCAVDCGIAINPDIVAAQMEGGIGFGLGAALSSAITLADGAVEQTNFDSYQVLRMSGSPREVEVHILPSAEAPHRRRRAGRAAHRPGRGQRPCRRHRQALLQAAVRRPSSGLIERPA